MSSIDSYPITYNSFNILILTYFISILMIIHHRHQYLAISRYRHISILILSLITCHFPWKNVTSDFFFLCVWCVSLSGSCADLLQRPTGAQGTTEQDKRVLERRRRQGQEVSWFGRIGVPRRRTGPDAFFIFSFYTLRFQALSPFLRDESVVSKDVTQLRAHIWCCTYPVFFFFFPICCWFCPSSVVLPCFPCSVCVAPAPCLLTALGPRDTPVFAVCGFRGAGDVILWLLRRTTIDILLLHYYWCSTIEQSDWYLGVALLPLFPGRTVRLIS